MTDNSPDQELVLSGRAVLRKRAELTDRIRRALPNCVPLVDPEGAQGLVLPLFPDSRLDPEELDPSSLHALLHWASLPEGGRVAVLAIMRRTHRYSEDWDTLVWIPVLRNGGPGTVDGYEHARRLIEDVGQVCFQIQPHEKLTEQIFIEASVSDIIRPLLFSPPSKKTRTPAPPPPRAPKDHSGDAKELAGVIGTAVGQWLGMVGMVFIVGPILLLLVVVGGCGLLVLASNQLLEDQEPSSSTLNSDLAAEVEYLCDTVPVPRSVLSETEIENWIVDIEQEISDVLIQLLYDSDGQARAEEVWEYVDECEAEIAALQSQLDIRATYGAEVTAEAAAEYFQEILTPLYCTYDLMRLADASHGVWDDGKLDESEWTLFIDVMRPIFENMASAHVRFREGLDDYEWPGDVQPFIDDLAAETNRFVRNWESMASVQTLDQYHDLELDFSDNAVAVVWSKLGPPSNIRDDTNNCERLDF